MTVDLNNHYISKVYSSGSTVTGSVNILAKRDVRCDALQIVLVGHTKTRVDGLSSPHELIHTFLKLDMPIPESTYLVPRVLEMGREYSIPFHFVIPSYLTINACNHHIKNDQIRDQHVLLPPSMGYWEKSDMSPQMAVVEYAVKARLSGDDGATGEADQGHRGFAANPRAPGLGRGTSH